MQSDPSWTEIFNGTTGNGTPFPCNVAGSVSLEYELATGTTAGAFNLTRSSNKDYAGDWDVLETHTIIAADLVAGKILISASNAVPGFCRIEATTPFSGGGDPRLIVRAKRYYN